MIYTPDQDPFTPSFARLVDYNNLIDGFGVLTVKDTRLDSTLKVVQEKVKSSRGQLAGLARHLKASTARQSAYNVWRFMKDYIPYRLDVPGSEQIRNPARSWADRARGVDCEDYTIFSACCLLEMGIKVDALIVAFDNDANRKRPESPTYGHIYALVDSKYPLDVVLNLFNINPPNIIKSVILSLNF
jgi:hypothetical protein